MKKVRVVSNITYSYTVEVEDDVTDNLTDLFDVCDGTEMLIYVPLADICHNSQRKGLIDSWDANTISMVDAETGEVFWNK